MLLPKLWLGDVDMGGMKVVAAEVDSRVHCVNKNEYFRYGQTVPQKLMNH